MSDDIGTTVEESDGMLTVTVTMPRNHKSLDGDSVVSAPVTVADVDVQADEDTVEAVAHALLGWYAEQQPTGPPEGKSITQQMDEVYDR